MKGTLKKWPIAVKVLAAALPPVAAMAGVRNPFALLALAALQAAAERLDEPPPEAEPRLSGL